MPGPYWAVPRLCPPFPPPDLCSALAELPPPSVLADTFVAYGGQTWADPKPHNFACTDAEEKGVPIVDSWIKMGPEQNNYEGPAHVRRNPPAPHPKKRLLGRSISLSLESQTHPSLKTWRS